MKITKQLLRKIIKEEIRTIQFRKNLERMEDPTRTKKATPSKQPEQEPMTKARRASERLVANLPG